MNDQEEGKATNEETRGIVCVLYDVYEGLGREGESEWVGGIEEEEKEKAKAHPTRKKSRVCKNSTF